MYPTLVLNVVGLTPRMVGTATPHLQALAKEGGLRSLSTVLPAVTCPAQATFLTGLPPSRHGCVANGWYDRELSEILFWRQSNRLVHGEKVWETARRRDPRVTCAKLFWWYNMYSTADFSVTPRPLYPADGRKIPDLYTQPADLRDELVARLGQFPLRHFWGPGADIRSSRWISACARHVMATRRPTLTLVYLPHLDYNLQRLGPEDPRLTADLTAIDTLCGELIEQAVREGRRVIVLSEYGMNAVTEVIHLNRRLREAGWLRIKRELGREVLDPGASEAFAVADHQVAHVYVRRHAELASVRAMLERTPGVERVLDAEGQRTAGLAHPRSGDLVAIAAPSRWFSYYYWLDDAVAPDFARTVDIHRKPGYDPAELFLDPALRLPPLTIGWTLLKRQLGFRTLLEVIPLEAGLVKGSHGRPTDSSDAGPLLLTSAPHLAPPGIVPATAVKDVILRHLFEP